MEEEYIMDERELAASLTLNKDGKTSKRELVKAMPSSCSIYILDFRPLAEKYALCVREDISGKVDNVLVDTAYNVRKYRNDNHAGMMCLVRTT